MSRNLSVAPVPLAVEDIHTIVDTIYEWGDGDAGRPVLSRALATLLGLEIASQLAGVQATVDVLEQATV